MVLYGDVPLVQSKTINNLLRLASTNNLAILTFQAKNPRGYGRIIRNSRGQVESIVEEKDASAQQKQIKEVNSGILAIRSRYLKKLLPKVNNKNASKEFYLTDIISLARAEGIKIKPLLLENPTEALGANTLEELHDLERACQRARAIRMVNSGVRIADVNRIDIRGNLESGKGTFIDVNNVFEGDVVLGRGVSIGPNCYIRDSKIEDGVVVNCLLYTSDAADE